MSEFDFWRECLTIPIDNIRDNRYYFYACEYMAVTELYDRCLTDERNSYDKTEAFVVGEQATLSRRYAKIIRDNIIAKIRKDLNNYCEDDCFIWKKVANQIHQYRNYSAQRWIDEYNRLIEERYHRWLEENKE